MPGYGWLSQGGLGTCCQAGACFGFMSTDGEYSVLSMWSSSQTCVLNKTEGLLWSLAGPGHAEPPTGNALLGVEPGSPGEVSEGAILAWR